jgi:hypothetical protein
MNRRVCAYEKARIYKKVKSVIRKKNRSSYIGEDDFVTLSKDGIVIRYHIKYPSLDIKNIFRAVKRAKKIVRDRFGHTLEKIDISIFSSKEDLGEQGMSKSCYASWIAGIYDGTIKVISEKEEDDPGAIYIILTHELIHLAIYEISKGCCPYWLDEGLSIYLSQELSDDYIHVLYEAMKSDRTYPLAALEYPFPEDAAPEFRILAYAEAASITSYLLNIYGWDKIRSILRLCSERDMGLVLADQLSLNYYLIEQGWKRWLRSRTA